MSLFCFILMNYMHVSEEQINTFIFRYKMESKEILRLVVLIALCMILESTGCEEERMVACHRPNMTCLRQMCYCLCNCRAPIETYYHRYVKCSNVTEVPKEIPNEAEEMLVIM